ncbi:protein bunched, class 2/F/G isoform [Anabrus simplex]|uniref:protein bunched, class 2/F/G isoform n=1 Tax=Anabrus simplex TaxID=316456 RepID=UPI0035A33AF7
MADNLSQKSPKPGDKTKLTNAINRTTSETMRLGEPEKSVNHPTSLASSTPNQRKKTPAFQITSVTVGPRITNDGGDDSADDLDESHTDDFSDVLDTSRITDIENETPSFSEDTFSKEDVFFNATAASLGTAPVIPTSSQYGLAIVASEGEGNNSAPVTSANSVGGGGDVHVSVTESGNVINIVSGAKQNETEMRDVHSHTGRNERFKVVKIESTEPFKRGRWMCMDYLDHTMQQHHQSQQPIIVRATESTDTGSVQYVGADSGVVITDGLGMQHGDDHYNMEQQHQHPLPNMAAAQSMPTPYSTISPGQTLQQVSMAINQHQSLQPQQMVQQGILPDQNNPHSVAQSMQQVVNQQQQIPQGQTQPMVPAQVIPQHLPQSMSQVPMQQTIPTPQQVVHHQSMPPQQIQQAMAAAVNMQKMQQQNMPAVGSQPVLPQHVPPGYVPQQYDQQSMMAAAQGMPHMQPQQYYAATSMGVPVSGMQLIPQTSITAQTQANPSSTSVHSIPTIVGTSQPQLQQPITSLPIQVSAHSIPVGGSVSNTAAGIPVSISQPLPMQQIPIPVPAQMINPQQLTPQQHQQYQQMLAQQQMQQKLPPQPQMVPQSMTSQQQLGQPMAPQQIPQQPMGLQTPQQPMGSQVPPQMGAPGPQQQMGAQAPQQIPQQQQQAGQASQQQQQQQQHMTPQQQMPHMTSQQSLPQHQQQQQQHHPPQQSQMAPKPQIQSQPMQQPQISMQQQMTASQQQPIQSQQQMQHQMHMQSMQIPQGIPPQIIPASAPNMQPAATAMPQVHRQLPLLPNQQGQPQHTVQTIPVDSSSTIPASAGFSSSSTSAPNQTFAPMVTASSVAAPMVSVLPQQVTATNVAGAPMGMSVNKVVGSVGKVGAGVSNVMDPNTGNVVGTVNNPKEVQQDTSNNMMVESLPDGMSAMEETHAAAPSNSGDDAESFTGLARALATSSGRHICRPRDLDCGDGTGYEAEDSSSDTSPPTVGLLPPPLTAAEPAAKATPSNTLSVPGAVSPASHVTACHSRATSPVPPASGSSDTDKHRYGTHLACALDVVRVLLLFLRVRHNTACDALLLTLALRSPITSNPWFTSL